VHARPRRPWMVVVAIENCPWRTRHGYRSLNRGYMMKKLLLATAALAAMTMAAKADGIINFQWQVGAGPLNQQLNQGNSATITPLPATTTPFIIQQITGSTQGFLTPPAVLDSNTLEVDNTTATTDHLIIWVTATNVTASSIQDITSSFDNV